ncbi:hypothetical protein [Actinoallomurus acaciae]|uniref:Uncharacterized protein n=1 Tax=Actinoallomurus acaciae TaxID=502577 RepID=A0ABV5YT15_9ACTN
MLHSRSQAHTTTTACHLRRLVNFVEPRRDDVCLDVSGASGLATAIRPWVGELTSATAGSLPSGSFTLVVAPLGHTRGDDQIGLVRDLLRVCGGRVVLVDLVRTRAGDGDRIERLRDPDRTRMHTFHELLTLVERAGGRTRRMDVFTVERPIDPWLAEAHDPDRILQELTAELDGGPPTGARPRLIGSELWFTQSWGYFAVEPKSRPRRRRGVS